MTVPSANPVASGDGPTASASEQVAVGLQTPALFTTVHTEYGELRCNYRVLFGRPATVQCLMVRDGASQARHVFTSGARFGLDLWRRNAYGTVQWRCFVCEALAGDEEGDWIPRVTPTVRVLLSTQGAAQSRLFLAWLRELEDDGFDPLGCPAEAFEAAHFRLAGSRADRIPPRRLSGRF